MKLPLTKELLFEYFAGRVTPLQKEMIREWASDPLNEEFFYACLHEWETRHPQYQSDVSRALDQFRKRLNQPLTDSEEATPINLNGPGRVRHWRWQRWTAAASVLLLMSLAAWWYQENLFFQMYTTAYGQKQNITLPDGSQVALNANSLLKVPRFGFGKSTRKVYLQGEANFSVVHTQDHQRFIVQTDSAFNVEVLGTEFTVLSRAQQKKVVLTRGKVKVHYQETSHAPEQLTMAPGDLVCLNQQGGLSLKKVNDPERFAAWKDNRFVFDKTPLLEINQMLSDNYGLLVEVRGLRIEEQTLSGSFEARSADELLQALAEVLDINVIRQDNRVILLDK